MINIRTFSRYISRNFSQSPNLVLQPLKERSLIRTSGENVADFLQGVITNDIRHLDQSPGNLFTMILNVKGRVLFDVIVYRTNENNSYLLECDREASNSLQKHLKMYRVRRKIDIADVSDEHHVFALFQSDINLTTTQPKDPMQTEGWIVPCDTLKDSLPENVTSTKFHKDIILFRDPRLTLLGSRIISKNDDLTLQQVKESVSSNVVQSNNEDYRIHRYKLGVGEGISDLPPGNCFPLECNCDYLHGVSFHKGCYIGQELTARTHHTGVIRKRLMPLLFNKPVARIPENGTLTYEKTNLGKLRGVIGVHGLGLLRVAKVLDIKEFPIEGVMASTMRPEWWPQEAPKEQINLQKAE